MCGTDLRNNTDPADQYKGFYSTHLFANRVIDIISKHEDDKVEQPPCKTWLNACA
ncbi:hypothetical protein DPMN_082534 [Dreissena polymorpha]|nr:hypothetical protein DPMN_082534 [Dreissena polymorpha]